MPAIPTPRVVNALCAAACLALLGFAYYSQLALGFEPCPLCIFQRLCVIGLAIVFIGATLHGADGWGTRVWGALVALTALTGVVIAGRHVWLQHLPPDLVPACGPGLDYLLDVLPIGGVLREVFTGSGECAKVDWTFLGMSMPEWTLLSFLGLGSVGTWNNLRRS